MEQPRTESNLKESTTNNYILCVWGPLVQGAPGTAGFTGTLFTSLYVAWSITLKSGNNAFCDFKLRCQRSILINIVETYIRARGGVVGRGTALQAGRSQVRFPMVSLKFFTDLILPATLWQRS